VHELDGSAGGGQLLRTALSLAALTGEPFRMSGIRGERPEPGVKPQHLACVRAVARTCDATAEGAEPGATELTFRPGSLEGGVVDVDVGTAGSVALVFDSLLPVAVGLPGELRVHARGGTHVRWAPTTDHHRLVKLPVLQAHGLSATLEVDRHGFYPAGGGTATLRLVPGTGVGSGRSGSGRSRHPTSRTGT
jgi:RNA 3'-terminal phosphate cyclase (ATP)